MTSAGGAHDVVVVGGRVAGSLTAAYCAARGLRVLVLEARHFPSPTMSTHFFRGDGMVRGLVDVGVIDQVLATGAPPLRSELFHVAGADGPMVGPPQEPGDAGFGLSVRRVTLDALLAAHVARLPGIDFRTGVKVVDLLRDGPQVVGVRDDAGDDHRATVVVGADGRRSLVAASAGAEDVRREPGCRLLHYRYVQGWTGAAGGAPDQAEFSLAGGSFAYAFPSDDDVTCLAISAHVREQTRSADFARLVGEHPAFAERAAVTTPLGRVVTGRADDNVVLAAAGPGWALVGDAGTHQDPWSGRGMDTAARQAKELAAALTGDASDWNSAYRAARDEVTLGRFEETVALAPDLRQILGAPEPA